MKTLKGKWTAIFIVMMTLGTAWAIRGRFGHEYGAAWAGAIGVLGMVLASGRKDWIRNWPVIMAIGAIGWGMTGMISYGIVIGYGRGIDLLNVSFGLYGLLVIGGLFGFLGGGFTGLILETSKDKKPNWAELITQMVAGGIISWGALIFQFDLLMTPPRSELWAACLGAAVALAWYMRRNGYRNALYVALYGMAGAGFGFAFGNFLQTMGHVSGISFNWWNVMEYSIGFFGGLGMAYAVFSRTWPEMPLASRMARQWSGVLLFLFIPFLVLINTFHWKKLSEMAERLSMTDVLAYVQSQWIQVAVLSLIALLAIGLQFRKSMNDRASYISAYWAFTAFWLWYFFLRTISSGTLYAYKFTSDDLAIPNLIAVLYLLYAARPKEVFIATVEEAQLNVILKRFLAGIVITLFILAVISINSHDEIPGLRKRFGNTVELTE